MPRPNPLHVSFVRRARARALVTVAVEAVESRLLLSAGDLDTTFGAGGKVDTGFSGAMHSGAKDAVLQSDGKIVVLTEGEDPDNARLARFTLNGQLDTTFGSGGVVVLPFQVGAFAVRGDNKIVVAGETGTSGQVGTGGDSVILGRYTANGQVDATFGGGDGLVTEPYFGGGQTDGKTIEKILIRPDNNRIYVTGNVDSFDNGLTQFALSAFNEDGTPYEQFGDQFTDTTTTEFGYTNHLSDALLTPDGHIVAVGTLTVSDSHHPNVQEDFAIARYDEHGVLDTSFSGDGKLLVDFGDIERNDPNSETNDAFDFAQSAALDSAGNLVVAGFSEDPTDDSPFFTALARVKPDGTLDATFGPGGADGDGRVTFQFSYPSSASVNDVAVLPTGKLLVSTATQGFTDIDFGLARLNANGSIDTSFGVNGKVFTDIGNDDLPRQLLLQSGKAVLVGASTHLNTQPGPLSSDLVMARYILADTPTQTPFTGVPVNVPGTIEFENYDKGGEGVAYHDTDSQNVGGVYRPIEGVDLQTIPTGGTTLAFAKAGEWTEYTINAAQAGTYNLNLFYASLKGGGRFHLEVDGRAVTPVTTVKSTGDWQRYQGLALNGVALSAGQHVLRLAMDGNDSTGYVANFDRVQFTRVATRTPFKGTPFVPNQQIEAEDYDNGGEGVAYHDTDAQNVGFSYRTSEGVDVQPAGDTGAGFNVGYAKASEWLIYSLNVQNPGTFGIQVRVASLKGGGRFHFEIDGKTVASFTAPNTGNWQKYVTLSSAKNISLSAGQHALRLVMDGNDSTGYVANFNWMKVVS
jgi:uncharacterized delta-60 repeat protein